MPHTAIQRDISCTGVKGYKTHFFTLLGYNHPCCLFLGAKKEQNDLLFGGSYLLFCVPALFTPIPDQQENCVMHLLLIIMCREILLYFSLLHQRIGDLGRSLIWFLF